MRSLVSRQTTWTLLHVAHYHLAAQPLTCRGFRHRADQHQAGLPVEPSRPLTDLPVVTNDEEIENEPVPDPEKDDMMARRTGSHHSRANQGANQFLPVPGTVRYTVSPVSAMKPLSSRQKMADKAACGRCVQAGRSGTHLALCCN